MRRMRTAFTGVGTALITPFTRSGALDEAAVRRLARRQIDAGVHFLVPCGTTGETPTLSDAERRRVVELVVEEADGPGAGAGRRRRLRHAAKSIHAAARDAEGRRAGPAVGDAVLQQADAGRAVPALQGDRRQHAAADRRLQRARPDRLQHRSGDAARGSRRSRTSSASRKRRATCTQMAEICRAVPARLPRAVGRRCADAAADGDRRPRHHLGGVERDAGRDGADGRSRRARRLRGRARDARRSCCR